MILHARAERPTTTEEAERLARDLYGLVTSATPLPGEYDDNFHLITSDSDGQAFVLKVMHPARERSFIDLQCQALQHVAQGAPQISLPRVVRTLNGEFFNSITSADGSSRLVWLLTFLPGTVLAKTRPHTRELLSSLGQLLGQMDAALLSFTHPAAHRELKWDFSRCEWIRDYLAYIKDPKRRALVEKFLGLYERDVSPLLPILRRSVIYGDANDYNVLVSNPGGESREVSGVIDFGDLHYGLTISEPAIAAAYAILGKEDLLPAAASVLAGYHEALPLGEAEFAAFYTLIGMRLAVSVTNSAYVSSLSPNDPYVTISESPAWDALERWSQIHPRFAQYFVRSACGLAPSPQSAGITEWLRRNASSAGSIVPMDLRGGKSLVFDLSVGSTFLGADPQRASCEVLGEAIFREMKGCNASVGIGRYDEARLLYTSELFGDRAFPTDERRTIHLGIDLFAEPGTPLYAPLDGTVHIATNNPAALDYGPLVILQHKTNHDQIFYTLYGHLTADSLSSLKKGTQISRGQEFARIGTSQENGGWPPHVHFQIITDLLELGANFPGVAYASEREVWTALCSDPNILLGIPLDRFPPKTPDPAEALAARSQVLGKNLSVSYNHPLKLVRGWMQYLYDETGRAYLDIYNNVPLVGHSHPRVVRAVQSQIALLNTNTRYLHDNITRYAERLVSLLPEPLQVCFFVNSGSEANELALRLARIHTGREDIIVLEHAYHGNTTTLIDISPYKFDGPGGSGRKPWVHVAPLADDYRGRYRRDDTDAGAKYAQHIAEILKGMHGENRGVAAFIAETLPSVGGQIVFPSGYLEAAYGHVRAAGGVCIADEVQVGFGRLGTHFWGFQTQGVVPDIVVLGKPIGNGFPLAAVVTTHKIATSFANGMEFFSTFGGNPVACAAGLAVLDVLEEESLQANALRIGDHLAAGLKDLQAGHVLIGDVRGSGLFLGVDLVNDRDLRTPATVQASYVVNRLREAGILAGTDGPHHNVLKLRPPLIFSEADAKLFLGRLGEIFLEDPAQPSPQVPVT